MNAESVFVDAAPGAASIVLVQANEFDAWNTELAPKQQASLARQQFQAKRGQTAWLSDDDNTVVVGWDGRDDIATLGHLPYRLPEGAYQLDSPVSEVQAVGWGLGAYRFSRYKSPKQGAVWPRPRPWRRHSPMRA